MTAASRADTSWSRAVGQIRPTDVPAMLRVLLLAVGVELAIRVLPLPLTARAVGVSLGGPPPPDGARPPTLRATEARAVRVARAVMRRWPLGTGTCLRRSLVIGHLVRRLRPALRIGITRDGGHIGAHAWLEVPGATNLGGQGHRAFEL